MSLRTPRRKLSHEVSEGILNLIDNGRVAVGDQLPPEPELIEMFQVSRTAVREAVKTLAAVGVLEIRHGVGTFVVGGRPGLLRSLPGETNRFDQSDLLELLEFRLIFEPEAAALAAERASATDLEELERCVAELERGVASGIKPPEDLGFHLAVARATKNRALLDVSSLTARFYQKDMYLPDDVDVHGHREIYEAIRNGDANAAREAMRLHLEEIERRYLQQDSKADLTAGHGEPDNKKD
jgi:GntR family transcriptional regulator, transcriptional repressor for pyruvate dehydrogenase complex